MAPSLNTVAVLLAGYMVLCGAQIELDDGFLQRKENDMWLIEFYAPWCGHCKKLEPVYREVSRELKGSSVRVGKVDVTRYADMAQHYEIKGFPTIKFIKGENIYTHHGDQTKDAILEFANRAQGPVLQKLTSVGKFTEAKSRHSDGVFFLYVGNALDDLYHKYHAAADAMLIQGHFYYGERRILQDMKTQHTPTLLVFKDKVVYEFSPKDEAVTKESIQKWMMSERHVAFPEASAGTLFQMVDTKKYLVIVVVNPTIKHRMDVNNRLKGVAENIALNQREKYHSEFQFVWMGETDTANRITSSSIMAPGLLVVEVANQQFYLPSFHPINVTLSSFTRFLDGVRDGTVPAQGGTGFFQRAKKIASDIIEIVQDRWETSPWSLVLIVVVPTSVFAVLIYAMCGKDPLEQRYTQALKELERESRQMREAQEAKAAEIKAALAAERAEEEKAAAEGKADEEKKEDLGGGTQCTEDKKKEEVSPEMNEEGKGEKDGNVVPPKGEEEKKKD